MVKEKLQKKYAPYGFWITCGKLSNFTRYNPVIINRNINTSTNNNKNNTPPPPTNISSTSHAKSSNPLNTTISINIQAISKTIQRAKLEKVDYKQSRTKSKWGIINLSACNNIHSDILIDLNTSGSKTPNINCDIYTQKFNITQNSNEKHTGNMEKIFMENETDNKDLQLSVNLRPPEPVGCQLLQMNSAPGKFNIIHNSIKGILDTK
ncbi:unnamed protein product [Schistosoma mattheei]|uniref:Uncharacterized protein n=1 Tax=Schistosoma mattheei TaxID=31246 RepID=A0A183NWS2_9TREM|nr:unnamed protein product [Schistosoma mattheei]